MGNVSEAEADLFIASALVGRADWPKELAPALVVERARYHGVSGLLADRLALWPAEAAGPIRAAARSQAIWELRHCNVLADLLGAFDRAGVRVLMLKGTALAYDFYRTPAERSRGDSDILITAADLPRARAVLTDRGFSHPKGDPGLNEEVRLQETWLKQTSDGQTHEVDLHWSALNSQVLADLISFEDGWTRSRPLPRLGLSARGLPIDLALLVACIHRAQHVLNPYFMDDQAYYNGDRLIWLWDIHLLVSRLDLPGWNAFLRACDEAGVAAAVIPGLEECARLLGSSLPPEAMARLSAATADTLAARYLLAGNRVERALADLRAARGKGGRLGYLWGQLFPPEKFMRARYDDGSERPLIVLYWRRIMGFLWSRSA